MEKQKRSWSLWKTEREAYAKRQSEGFKADIEALKKHINRLEEITPSNTGGLIADEIEEYMDELYRALHNAKAVVNG